MLVSAGFEYESTCHAPTPGQTKLAPSTLTPPLACRSNGSGLRALSLTVPEWTYSSVGASHGLLSSQTMQPRSGFAGRSNMTRYAWCWFSTVILLAAWSPSAHGAPLAGSGTQNHKDEGGGSGYTYTVVAKTGDVIGGLRLGPGGGLRPVSLN